MMKNELILDNFSSPQNHPLLIAKQIYEALEKEMHVDELIKRVVKKRKNIGNVSDEARVIKGIGILIALRKVSYYKGFLFRNVS